MTQFSPEMRRTSRSGAGFTLIELLTVIAIIGILASILIPVVGRVRDSARQAQCMSNVRQWGMAVLMYAEDHDGTYALRPPEGSDGWSGTGDTAPWAATTAPYTLDYMDFGSTMTEEFRGCPAARPDEGITFAMMWPDVNGEQPPRDRIPLSSAREPTSLMIITDSTDNHPDDATMSMNGSSPTAQRGATQVFELTQDERADERHRGRMNAFFADGHSRTVHWYAGSESGDRDSFEDQWERWSSIFPEHHF